tara:strand:+ start:1047 stop:1322 length:276 start_codon:yes stop_codon:yes gene_type:complete
MTKSSKQELKTKKKYNKLPDVQKKRVENNRRRREAERNNLVKKGDGKHIDHKKPLAAGGSMTKSNTRVVSASTNKGWRKKHPKMYKRRTLI